MILGVQSYSLRNLSYEKALEVISNLGFKYVEAYPRHLEPKAENVGIALNIHKKFGIKLISHGVNRMSEKGLKELFDFANSVEIEILTADPDEETLPKINDLVKEYNIKVAIHNHGPNHRWGSYKKIYEKVENLDSRIGMCLDLAHLARYGENPLEAIEKLGKRILEIHLKDVNENGSDDIIGKGVLNIKDVMKKAKELDIPIMIEYELDDPVNGIKKSLEFLMSM
ncbi:sugar phosphate isomerase/epimerase [Sulfolobus sp. B5]|nr:sugar phosphate isomerase/epimerase [Sulfolobus sp. B5]